MTDKACAAAWIRDLAVTRLDGVLLSNGGFRRTGSSTTYLRKVDGGKQRIYLDLLVRPPYSRDSFHLALRCSVAFPDVAKIAAAMLADATPGFGRSGVVGGAPLDSITMNPPMMLFRTEAELQALAPDIERHLVDSVVPYLDARDSVAKLTAGNAAAWSANGTPGGLSHLPVIIAAGQLAMGDIELARKTLDEAYPAGSRGRQLYHAAFLVVESAVSTPAT